MKREPRAGLIAPDEKTFDYIRGREFAPVDFAAAVRSWQQLPTDDGAAFDRSLSFHATDVVPQVTWGTNPGQVVDVTSRIPSLADFDDETDRKAAESALKYMGLEPGTPIGGVRVDRVFIGLLHERPN